MGGDKEREKERVWRSSPTPGWSPAEVSLQAETNTGALLALGNPSQKMSERQVTKNAPRTEQKIRQETETSPEGPSEFTAGRGVQDTQSDCHMNTPDGSQKEPQWEEGAKRSLAGGSIYTPSVQTPSEKQGADPHYVQRQVTEIQGKFRHTSTPRMNEGFESFGTVQSVHPATRTGLDTSPERTIHEPEPAEQTRADKGEA